MKRKITVRKIAVFVFFFTGVTFLLTTEASAYIDPATTAMLTQIIAGVFITLGVVFGMFRRRIIMFFKNLSISKAKRKIEKEAEKKSKKEAEQQSKKANGE